MKSKINNILTVENYKSYLQIVPTAANSFQYSYTMIKASSISFGNNYLYEILQIVT